MASEPLREAGIKEARLIPCRCMTLTDKTR